MVQNLAELYTVSKAVDPSSEALFILKDNLIASGVASLVKVAEEQHVPLITSDEGTVSQGGACALGIREAQIGEQGGRLAARLFRSEIVGPYIEEMDEIQVFVNPSASKKQGLDPQRVQQSARDLGYETVQVGS